MNLRFNLKITLIKSYFNYVLSRKKGLEVGGPSPAFVSCLPVYKSISLVDNVIFSETNLWRSQAEAIISDKAIATKFRDQFILEATDLSSLNGRKYDFVLCSHTLEHIANPIKALIEFKSLLNKGGVIVLLLPDKRFTFDHLRPYTSFAHILSDFIQNKKESDLSHLQEILDKHDLSRDAEAGDFNNFRNRSINNTDNRCLHHHVFSLSLLNELCLYLNLEPVFNHEINPHILSVMKNN
jgi:SAM-dependent methyltransferase